MMFKFARPLSVMFAVLTVLTGLLYPLVVTGIAQLVFPHQANGSLIEQDARVIGSALIGQDFQDPKYFWGRPSATAQHPYNAYDPLNLTGSSGSNLGPLSRALAEAVRSRVARLESADPGSPRPIPVDLVTASASGLDPHISLAAAYYQAGRVARQRELSIQDVQALIEAQLEDRQFGVLGEPRLNVLLLNLALDRLQPLGTVTVP